MPAATHGPQFDNFRADSGIHHGGAKFDENFPQTKAADPHGKLFDQFSEKPGLDRYGEHWDRFPWKEPPSPHGTQFDSGFAEPTARDGGTHGGLFDVFRGGAVRYIKGGRDYEGVVLNTGADHATVVSREGEQHEIGLEQVLAYCEAAALQGNPHVEQYLERATPSPFDFSVDGEVFDAQEGAPHPGPQGERPSGESSHAMGGGRSASSTEIPDVTEHVTGKTADSLLLDVCKGGSDKWTCMDCGHKSDKLTKGNMLPAKCPSCKSNRTVWDWDLKNQTGKTADSSETALQKQDMDGGGSDLWCPKCQHVCRNAEDGHCPTCGSTVTEQKAEKAWMAPLDVLKSYSGTPRAEREAAAAKAHPLGSTVSTTVNGIGGRSENVSGQVVGHKRGMVHVQTKSHGTLAVELHKVKAGV